ncbi:hypothetical protein BGZ52_009890 [Haplosporangium bisporale]|nr:hypothetical protein BGZ52_009890 [Haplosporangium bisporale]
MTTLGWDTTQLPSIFASDQTLNGGNNLIPSEPIPQETLDAIPAEVWVLILTFVPPARLAVLSRVCRQWKGIIEHQLPLWRYIAVKCALGDGAQQGNTMELVLGHTLVICELCLEASRKGVGSDLPLPVNRQDALGKTWMCRRCRRRYYTKFPQPTRLAQPRDYDSVPSPIDPQGVQDNHVRLTYSLDEAVLVRARAVHGGDIGIVAHQVDANLNHLLRRRRRKMLTTKLALVGLEFRSDSKLCGTYLRGSWYDPGRVADVMKEMEWYYAETSYWDFMNDDFGSATSKIEAMAEWLRILVREHGWGSRETYKRTIIETTADEEDVLDPRQGRPRLLPPPSLWPLIDGWLQHMFEHMGGSEDMDLWDTTYRPDPGAFTISIETDDEEE